MHRAARCIDRGDAHGAEDTAEGPVQLHASNALARYFVALNVALVIVVLLTLWATGNFERTGLSTNGWVALSLGILLASALGISLMGLVFYSNREDVDDRAYHATDLILAATATRPTRTDQRRGRCEVGETITPLFKRDHQGSYLARILHRSGQQP